MMKDPIKEMKELLCESINGKCNGFCVNCNCMRQAEALHGAGYCKKSVVVEEVFQNILQILADADLKYETASEEGNPAVNYIFNAVVTLKNKYKGGATDERKID